MNTIEQICIFIFRKEICIILLVAVLAGGCTGTNQVVMERDDSGYYKNPLQSQVLRDHIEEGFRSVVRIQNNVIYRTYQFFVDDRQTRSVLETANFEDVAAQSYLDDQSSAGTAIVLNESSGKYALLTASHTVFYPDTVWHYRTDHENPEERFVEAVSVRESVNYILLNEKGVIKLELVTNDPARDLAVMTNSERRVDLMTPLSLPFGRADELDWGDIVYALGYPKGAKMVTMGTASRSDHPVRSILIDASFNRGFSGGALFAVRNNNDGLELIGLVTSALGESEIYLAPNTINNEEYDPDVPYTGDVFVKTAPRINYGITNAVDVDVIMQFLRENRTTLNDAGLGLP